MATAARREEIQRQVQQLRETREREQAAFDAIAAEHPELTVEEITALAEKKATEDVPQSLTFHGAEVRVGERVNTKDDVQLLHRADRGHFIADPLKSVYLGERGEVVRVMQSFQGKPAVELRFADGVTKIFFAECLDLVMPQRENSAGSSGSGNRVVTRHVDPTRKAAVADDLSSWLPPAPPPPPKAEALPGWGQLFMPHRGRAMTTADAGLPVGIPPPPPPTVAAIRGAPAQRKVRNDVKSPSSSPSTSSAPACSVTKAVVELPTKGELRANPPKTVAAAGATPAIIKKEPPGVLRSSPLPPQVVCCAVSPDAVSTTKHATSALGVTAADVNEERGLGSPGPCQNRGMASNEFNEANTLDDVLDLRPTPDSSPVNRGDSPSTPSRDADDAPRSCSSDASATEQGHALENSRGIPSAQSPDVTALGERRHSRASPNAGFRLCWLAGIKEIGKPLSEPVRVSFRPQCRTMFAVFATVSQKLRWDKQGTAASRLFSDQGVEIKSAGAVCDGMRLVATTGCVFKPNVASATLFDSIVNTQPAPACSAPAGRTAQGSIAKLPRPVHRTGAPSETASSAAVAAAAGPSALPNSSSPLPARMPAAAAKRSSNVASSQPSASPTAPKSLHIRVYENGFYDDNIYHTVTVRSTYKTLAALKTVITRALQWRGGKRVDLLFDASGAEITDLNELIDGDSVVASAGNPFVIPYPNTAIHRDAVQLLKRLH